jgi:hypothetical protein
LGYFVANRQFFSNFSGLLIGDFFTSWTVGLNNKNGSQHSIYEKGG